MKLLLKSNITPDYPIDTGKEETKTSKWIKSIIQPYVELSPEGILKNTTFVYAPAGNPKNTTIKMIAYGILILILFSIIYTIIGVIKK